MWTIKELICMDTPFLSMNDITDEDWACLDFELEKYDRANAEYDLNECKVLAFVLQELTYNKENYSKVPTFIRMGKQFKNLAVKYNPELKHVIFN